MSSSVFNTEYQEFIFKRTYSRWKEDEGRRETWPEAVGRFAEFFIDRVPEGRIDRFEKVMDAIHRLDVMPSMRAFWTAGEALDFDNVCAYNCAYTVIESPRDFAEILYILMNGTGVGFSTERKYVERLPEVPEERRKGTGKLIVVEDSKQGWAKAFKELLDTLFAGAKIPTIDYSEIRPKGARLKTFGGRASGPEPLKELFEFTIDIFKNAKGRKLTSLECYDIVCKTAAIVIVGGVRRSATINLSDLDDDELATAKEGKFWIDNPQRSLSNNSVVYNEKPSLGDFMSEWKNLATSGTGERGIVNREGLQEQATKFGRRDPDHEYGVNPCGEVALRPWQFCNLTEVVIRPEDTLNSLMKKVEYATILGVLQSTLTDFNFISDKWRKNVEEERLLGVSLTGLKDHPVLAHTSEESKKMLRLLHDYSLAVANIWADEMEINRPKAITSVKPSGTVSQLVNSASGIHPRYAKYYIRRVRVAANDPVAQMLADIGVPNEPEIGDNLENPSTLVFEFPVKGPEESVTRGDETAIEQLEYWKMLKTNWTEHNPSQTIYVKEGEWLEVGAWVYENFDLVTGLSFLPYDGGVYELAPYEPIDKEEYEALKECFPNIYWTNLKQYEQIDQTIGSREYACKGGECEL